MNKLLTHNILVPEAQRLQTGAQGPSNYSSLWVFESFQGQRNCIISWHLWMQAHHEESRQAECILHHPAKTYQWTP